MALALGKSIGEVLGLDAVEIAVWQAYDRIEPFGDERADLRSGLAAASLVNVQLSSKARPLSALDFMPFADKPKEPEPPSVGARLMQALKDQD